MIKVGIAEDHVLVRQGIIGLMNNFENIQVVVEADNGQELLDKMVEIEVDVILMDLNMPVLDGYDTTKIVTEKYPKIKVLGLSQHHEERYVNHLIQLGGRGYLLKNTDPEELKYAIEQAFSKGFYVNDHVTLSMLNGMERKYRFRPQFDDSRFTKSEKEVLIKLCEGMSSAQIAAALDKSARTVENQRKSMMDKAGANNTVGLVIHAIRNNIIELEEVITFD